MGSRTDDPTEGHFTLTHGQEKSADAEKFLDAVLGVTCAITYKDCYSGDY